MATEQFLIETGVDRLIKLIKDKKRVSLGEAAKLLKVPTAIITEWANFLEEEGVIKVTYVLTTPILQLARLPAEEIERKESELDSKKENMAKKIMATLTSIEENTQDLADMRDELDRISQDISTELVDIRNKMQELRQYEDAKDRAQQGALLEAKQFQEMLGQLNEQLEQERGRFKSLGADIAGEEKILRREKSLADQIGSEEKQLARNLDSLKNMISRLSKKIGPEAANLKAAKELEQIRKKAASIEQQISERKASLVKVGAEIRDYEAKIRKTEKDIKASFRKHQPKIAKGGKVKSSIDRAKAMLEHKKKADECLKKVEGDVGAIRFELEALLKKAQALKAAVGSGKAKACIKELEAMNRKVMEKHKEFSREMGLLRDAVHKL